MDIPGAQKKLRQAEFFLGHLEEASSAYLGRPQADSEVLEYWFSACLSAAQSVYYVLQDTGGSEFKTIQKRWRDGLPEQERWNFGRMIGLRGQDVHLGRTGAEPLQKYVEEDRIRSRSPYYQFGADSGALFGPRPLIEEENPDGKKVRGGVLRGSTGLYVKREGRYVESDTACREFIDHLRSLLEAVEKAKRGADNKGAEQTNPANCQG